MSQALEFELQGVTYEFPRGEIGVNEEIGQFILNEYPDIAELKEENE